jgi:hypothetical protein
LEYNYAAYPIISESVNEIAEEVRTFFERFDFVPQNSIVVGGPDTLNSIRQLIPIPHPKKSISLILI